MTGAANGRRHSRDDVARAALAILDEYGLPDLTMRRLAASLDVQASALYWHFPNKQTLIAELADRIIGRAALTPVVASPSDPGDWRGGVQLSADRLRDSLLAYRDGAEVVTSTLALGLGTRSAAQGFADALSAAGFDPRTTARASNALLHYVLGHVQQEQQRLQYDSLGVSASRSDSPDLAADASSDFRFGVGLLVSGLSALHPAR